MSLVLCVPVLILPVTTKRLQAHNDLASIIAPHTKNGDILIVSSKALATIEDCRIKLSELRPSEEAIAYAKKCRQDPAFTEAVLQETARLHGTVVGTCPWALLTAVKPDGMKRGRILCPNAGLDQSNVDNGYAIGWPKDAVMSATKLRDALEENGTRVAVIVTDSGCRPGRQGVTAFALTVAGMDPMLSQVGRSDLFGMKLKFTHEAVADQLATAGNAVMGNADQATPVAVIRDHGYAFSDFCGWVEGISSDDDLFSTILRT